MSTTHRSPSDKKRYTDPDFIWYFDVDPVDLSYIMMKKSKGFHVTSEESDRFGKYVIGMIGQVLLKPVYIRKPYWLKEHITEYAILYVLQKWSRTYVPQGKASGFLHKVCECGCAMSQRKDLRAYNKAKRIEEHLKDCYDNYDDEVMDHKVRAEINQDDFNE